MYEGVTAQNPPQVLNNAAAVAGPFEYEGGIDWDILYRGQVRTALQPLSCPVINPKVPVINPKVPVKTINHVYIYIHIRINTLRLSLSAPIFSTY